MAGTIPSTFRDGVVTITDDAGHSATLVHPNGDQKLTGLMPGGAMVDVFESQGHIVGARLGARAIPQFSVSAIVAAGLSAFEALLLGTTSGYVSTTADIGDAKCVDLSYTFNYGAETRTLTAQDVCLVGGIEKSAGTPSTVSYSLQFLGPVTLDGTTIIAAR